MAQPTKWTAIDVEELYIKGEKVDLTGKKLQKIATLKSDADPAAIVKKYNELIAQLKLAGLMEND